MRALTKTRGEVTIEQESSPVKSKEIVMTQSNFVSCSPILLCAQNGLMLRKASPSDSTFAFYVKKAAFKAYVENVWDWDDDKQRQLHEQRFGTQDFGIIELAGIDIGITAVVVTTDCVNVNQLFLLPEYQDKGIGRRCMLFIMKEARKLGLPVRLRVMKVNPRALAFYERLGFMYTGETDTHNLLEWDS